MKYQIKNVERIVLYLKLYDRSELNKIPLAHIEKK